MKILLDECVPKAIKQFLSVEGHECSTVPEAGFAGKTNGELLRLAADGFEAFVTLDKGVRFQQNLAAQKIGIVLIRAKSSRVSDILPHIRACLDALRSIRLGEIIEISGHG
jgi:predicted nuclease of predicted toxin-antitoxin system